MSLFQQVPVKVDGKIRKCDALDAIVTDAKGNRKTKVCLDGGVWAVRMKKGTKHYVRTMQIH